MVGDIGNQKCFFLVLLILLQISRLGAGAAAYGEYSDNKANSAQLSWGLG